MHHASHAYKHKRKCTVERGPKTKDDTDDELLAIENERVYKTLTNENDKKIFRSCVTPLFQLNRRSVGFNFKHSAEDNTS